MAVEDYLNRQGRGQRRIVNDRHDLQRKLYQAQQIKDARLIATMQDNAGRSMEKFRPNPDSKENTLRRKQNTLRRALKNNSITQLQSEVRLRLRAAAGQTDSRIISRREDDAKIEAAGNDREALIQLILDNPLRESRPYGEAYGQRNDSNVRARLVPMPKLKPNYIDPIVAAAARKRQIKEIPCTIQQVHDLTKLEKEIKSYDTKMDAIKEKIDKTNRYINELQNKIDNPTAFSKSVKEYSDDLNTNINNLVTLERDYSYWEQYNLKANKKYNEKLICNMKHINTKQPITPTVITVGMDPPPPDSGPPPPDSGPPPPDSGPPPPDSELDAAFRGATAEEVCEFKYKDKRAFKNRKIKNCVNKFMSSEDKSSWNQDIINANNNNAKKAVAVRSAANETVLEFDMNKNGFIARDEMKAYLKAIGEWESEPLYTDAEWSVSWPFICELLGVTDVEQGLPYDSFLNYQEKYQGRGKFVSDLYVAGVETTEKDDANAEEDETAASAPPVTDSRHNLQEASTTKPKRRSFIDIMLRRKGGRKPRRKPRRTRKKTRNKTRKPRKKTRNKTRKKTRNKTRKKNRTNKRR